MADDPNTSALILELQQEDLKNVLGDITDPHGPGNEALVVGPTPATDSKVERNTQTSSSEFFAFQLYGEELSIQERLLADIRMAKSLSTACQLDGRAIGPNLRRQDQMHRDRQLAEQVGLRPPSPPLGMVELAPSGLDNIRTRATSENGSTE